MCHPGDGLKSPRVKDYAALAALVRSPFRYYARTLYVFLLFCTRGDHKGRRY